MNATAQVIAMAGDRVAVGITWQERSRPDADNELYQVLTLAGGSVVQMQDYARKRDALDAVVTAA